MTPHDFLDMKMALAARFAFRETSGYRHPLWNETVGGAATSQHQVWLGTDIVLWYATDLAAFKKQAGRLGLTVVDEGDHLHLQPKGQ